MNRSVLALIFIVGCASFVNLSASDIRKEKYLVKNTTTGDSIKDIQAALFEYSQNCKALPEIKTNPADPGRGVLTYSGVPGPTQSIVVVIDLEQAGADSTNIKAYSYYGPNNHIVNHFFKALDYQNEC